jgi:hypothetical protein
VPFEQQYGFIILLRPYKGKVLYCDITL